MPEKKNRGALIPRQREMTVRYRGRGSQVWIYFGKMLRMFVYQSDWKVIPMSALIAGLVGFVIRRICHPQKDVPEYGRHIDGILCPGVRVHLERLLQFHPGGLPGA